MVPAEEIQYLRLLNSAELKWTLRLEWFMVLYRLNFKKMEFSIFLVRHVFVCLFVYFLMAAPVACGTSWARDWIQATAATVASGQLSNLRLCSNWATVVRFLTRLHHGRYSLWWDVHELMWNGLRGSELSSCPPASAFQNGLSTGTWLVWKRGVQNIYCLLPEFWGEKNPHSLTPSISKGVRLEGSFLPFAPSSWSSWNLNSFFIFVLLPFLGPLLRHMEVPTPGVELEP